MYLFNKRRDWGLFASLMLFGVVWEFLGKIGRWFVSGKGALVECLLMIIYGKWTSFKLFEAQSKPTPGHRMSKLFIPLMRSLIVANATCFLRSAVQRCVLLWGLGVFGQWPLGSNCSGLRAGLHACLKLYWTTVERFGNSIFMKTTSKVTWGI